MVAQVPNTDKLMEINGGVGLITIAGFDRKNEGIEGRGARDPAKRLTVIEM